MPTPDEPSQSKTKQSQATERETTPVPAVQLQVNQCKATPKASQSKLSVADRHGAWVLRRKQSKHCDAQPCDSERRDADHRGSWSQYTDIRRRDAEKHGVELTYAESRDAYHHGAESREAEKRGSTWFKPSDTTVAKPARHGKQPQAKPLQGKRGHANTQEDQPTRGTPRHKPRHSKSKWAKPRQDKAKVSQVTRSYFTPSNTTPSQWV
jgi:hypothetical protein